MDTQQQPQDAERMRVKQILHRAKQDIEKIFLRVEQELCADLSEPLPIFQQIEQYFGRPFSGAELEDIRFWMDKYPPELIQVAIGEASIRNIQNIRYIDRILLNWEKAGIRDAKAAVEKTTEFRQRASPQPQPAISVSSPPKVPFYNWLEERE